MSKILGPNYHDKWQVKYLSQMSRDTRDTYKIRINEIDDFRCATKTKLQQQKKSVLDMLLLIFETKYL